MPVPAAKVKEVCTAQEAELVRASRRPALSKLTPAQLKQRAKRARKLYDKWLAQSREQSRVKSRKTGFGESKANTKLKVEIFGDALQNFESALAKQDSKPAPKKKVAKKKQTPKKKPATKKTTKKKSTTTKKKAPKKSKRKNAPPKKSATKSGLSTNKKKRREATAAAKKARIARSGLTSRVAGHVSARGKRAQASRDARN